MLLGCVWFDCCVRCFKKHLRQQNLKANVGHTFSCYRWLHKEKCVRFAMVHVPSDRNRLLLLLFFCCSLVLTLFVEFGDSYVRYVFSAVLQVKLIQLCISCAHTHTHLVILNTVASLSSTNRPKMFVSNGKKNIGNFLFRLLFAQTVSGKFLFFCCENGKRPIDACLSSGLTCDVHVANIQPEMRKKKQQKFIQIK